MRVGKVEDTPFQMLLHHLDHMIICQAVCQLEDFEISPSQARVLFILDREGVLSQRELAERIGVKPPSMTVALRKMERLEYVTRENDKNDMRIIRITLTEKGKNCVDEVKGIFVRAEENLLRGFSQEERMLMKRLLLQMRDNLMSSKDMKNMDMNRMMRKMCGNMNREL